MIRLLALDLDGTFYAGKTLGVPESAWAAIERGKNAGLKFAVCTGRPQGGFGQEYAQQIEPDGPHVFNDGASVCNAAGKTLHIEPLPNASQLVAIARRYGLAFDMPIGGNERYYEPELIPPGIHEHVEITGIPAVAARLEEISDPILRIWFVVSDLSLWETARPDILAVPNIDIAEYISPREVVTGVIKKGVSKSTGLQWLARHYGIALEEIAMIGDSHNDLEAIRDAGMGIAMGNALDEIKAVATHVTGHVRENGFAEAVDRILEHNRRQ